MGGINSTSDSKPTGGDDSSTNGGDLSYDLVSYICKNSNAFTQINSRNELLTGTMPL